MQVMAFVILMIVLFVVSLVFIVAGFITQFMAGRFKKKRLRIFGIVVLCIGIVAAVIPIGWFTMIRMANGMVDEDYVDTGIMIQWDSYNTFTYEGQKYKRLNITDEDDFLYSDNQIRTEKSAVFNICRKGFWETLFNAYEKEVMYTVENGVEVSIYSDGYDIFYPITEEERVLDYYTDFYSYEWYCFVCDVEDNEETYKLNLTKQEIDLIEQYSGVEMEETDENIDMESEYISIYKISPDEVYRGEMDASQLPEELRENIIQK